MLFLYSISSILSVVLGGYIVWIQYFPVCQYYFSLKILVFNKETIQITGFGEYIQACFEIPFPVSLSLTLHAFYSVPHTLLPRKVRGGLWTSRLLEFWVLQGRIAVLTVSSFQTNGDIDNKELCLSIFLFQKVNTKWKFIEKPFHSRLSSFSGARNTANHPALQHQLQQ